jgi:hypothetical protein
MPKNETVISQNKQAEGGVQVVTQWLGFFFFFFWMNFYSGAVN